MYATTDCSNYTQVSTCVSQSSGSGSFNISSNVNLVVGQTYYVMLDGFAGNVCNYTVTAQSGVNTNAAQIIASQNQVCPGKSATLASGVTASSANSYTWASTPSGTYPNTQTITITPSSTTVYTLTIGASPCSTLQTTAVTTVVVTNTLSPANITAPNLVCYGSGVNISSLTNGGTYIWTGPGGFTSATQNNNIPSWATSNNGTYNLTIDYGGGCVTTPTLVTINGVNPPVVTLTSSSPTVCAGSSFTLTASGGTGINPYNWNWDLLNTSIIIRTCDPLTGLACANLSGIIPGLLNGANTVTVTPSISTTVCTTVKNSSGCSATSCFSISVINCTTTSCPTLTLAVTSQTNVNCFGSSTGLATVNTTGGAGAYTYTWLPGNLSGASQTALAAGVYTVNIKDVNNCTGSGLVTITQPTAALALSLIGTSPSACGSSNGSATVSATGGTASYTYSWIPAGGSGASASALNAGSYTIGVMDSKGCFTITTANINSAGGPTISVVSSSNVSCFGGNNGAASVTSSGGNNTYTWTPGNLSGASQTTLTAGVYNVSTSDNSGCANSIVVTITQPTVALTASISASNTTCGGNTGSATVTINGGTPTYNYAWLPSGGSSATASNLGVGNYTVTITDVKSCTVNAVASIISAGGGATLSIASQSNITCFGGNNGSASVTLIGGVGTYTWLPTGGNSSSASNLQAGTYTIVATVSGCSTYTTITITEAAQINVTVNTTSANCTAADGSATANAIGGSGTYTYTWSNTTTGASLNNVLAGTYSVLATDANGCMGSAIVNIGTNNSGFAVNAGTGTTIEFGQSTTLNGIVPTGATYTWTPAGTLSCYNCLTPIATPTQNIIYTLMAIDGNGCLAIDTVIILVHIPCGELFVPTAFSPNGDGSNDELYVYGNCITELEFAIFDRWGERVFETTDKTIGWDGTYKGRELNAAGFAYLLKATVNGQTVVKKGAVALVR